MRMLGAREDTTALTAPGNGDAGSNASERCPEINQAVVRLEEAGSGQDNVGRSQVPFQS